jgi:hypothetical protein
MWRNSDRIHVRLTGNEPLNDPEVLDDDDDDPPPVMAEAANELRRAVVATVSFSFCRKPFIVLSVQLPTTRPRARSVELQCDVNCIEFTQASSQ